MGRRTPRRGCTAAGAPAGRGSPGSSGWPGSGRRLSLRNAGRDLGLELRRVRLARGEDDADPWVEVRNGIDQGRDPLLAGHPSDEQDVRGLGIDLVPRQRVALRIRREGDRVDPVVDDVDPGIVDLEVLEHVLAGRVADRDDGIGLLQRLALDPGRGVVAAPQLLALPWPQRLEGVDGHDQRQPVGLAHDQAAEVRVPGVAMDEVRVRGVDGHGQVPAEGTEDRAQRLSDVVGPSGGRVPANAPARLVVGLVAEGPDVELDSPRSAFASSATCTPAPPYTDGGNSLVSMTTRIGPAYRVRLRARGAARVDGPGILPHSIQRTTDDQDRPCFATSLRPTPRARPARRGHDLRDLREPDRAVPEPGRWRGGGHGQPRDRAGGGALRPVADRPSRDRGGDRVGRVRRPDPGDRRAGRGDDRDGPRRARGRPRRGAARAAAGRGGRHGHRSGDDGGRVLARRPAAPHGAAEPRAARAGGLRPGRARSPLPGPRAPGPAPRGADDGHPGRDGHLGRVRVLGSHHHLP